MLTLLDNEHWIEEDGSGEGEKRLNALACKQLHGNLSHLATEYSMIIAKLFVHIKAGSRSLHDLRLASIPHPHAFQLVDKTASITVQEQWPDNTLEQYAQSGISCLSQA